ncbi:MAG: FAD-dependent oxidoreductase [Gammaproteobacteria bacterium]
MKTQHCQVAIIGAGPSGLALASELARADIDVVVLEREGAAGGIPRHCGHSPYGMREFHRLMSGPAYAARLTREAAQQGAKIWLHTTVTEIEPGGRLLLSTIDGMQELQATRVVICTGNRETPRAARLVSGTRPMGIVTTGALQSMVYLKHRLPFERPLIVGSELVSFSALLTCRHAGIKPVAMVDSYARVTALKAAALLPRLLGIPLLLNTEIDEIRGGERIESVAVSDASGNLQEIACDGVIFSGNFVAEASLVRSSQLEFDPRSGGPVVDQYGRCSDPAYFACGNLLHPVDTAGWCWAEGMRTARLLLADLNAALPRTGRVLEIETASPGIRYFTPQRIRLPDAPLVENHPGLQLRFAENRRGRISWRGDKSIISSCSIRAQRERRVLLPLPSRDQLSECTSLALEFRPDIED